MPRIGDEIASSSKKVMKAGLKGIALGTAIYQYKKSKEQQASSFDSGTFGSTVHNVPPVPPISPTFNNNFQEMVEPDLLGWAESLNYIMITTSQYENRIKAEKAKIWGHVYPFLWVWCIGIVLTAWFFKLIRSFIFNDFIAGIMFLILGCWTVIVVRRFIEKKKEIDAGASLIQTEMQEYLNKNAELLLSVPDSFYSIPATEILIKAIRYKGAATRQQAITLAEDDIVKMISLDNQNQILQNQIALNLQMFISNLND